MPLASRTRLSRWKSGRLLDRVMSVFDAVTSANTNPDWQRVQQIEAPKLAAHHDAIFLDSRLYDRVEEIFKQRDTLKLDAESLRLVEVSIIASSCMPGPTSRTGQDRT